VTVFQRARNGEVGKLAADWEGPIEYVGINLGRAIHFVVSIGDTLKSLEKVVGSIRVLLVIAANYGIDRRGDDTTCFPAMRKNSTLVVSLTNRGRNLLTAIDHDGIRAMTGGSFGRKILRDVYRWAAGKVFHGHVLAVIWTGRGWRIWIPRSGEFQGLVQRQRKISIGTKFRIEGSIVTIAGVWRKPGLALSCGDTSTFGDALAFEAFVVVVVVVVRSIHGVNGILCNYNMQRL